MAVNPKLIALTLKTLTTEKGREKLIIGIVIFVMFLLFFIALPIYILTEPIESQYGYTVISEFGYRTHPITKIYKLHSGIDIVGKIYGNILSVADGEVLWAGLRGAYGNCINIKHTLEDGTEFYSFYAHLARISTGSHLHFEIRLSSNGNFQNPREYIGNI